MFRYFACHTNLDRAQNGVSGALAACLDLTGTDCLENVKENLVKFVTFVPPDYTEKVRLAASDAGAGIIGDYSMCSFTCRGEGTYLPSRDASPYAGEAGELSRVTEDRLEMVVSASALSRVIDAVKRIHPYDKMAYDIIPLSTGNGSFGYGVVGDLREVMAPKEFATFVGKRLKVPTVTVSRTEKKSISRVAVMGGSGRSHIRDAVASGADAYVTGSIGHHDFIDYGGSIMLVDASHRATELPVLGWIAKRLKNTALASSLGIFVEEGNTISTVFNVEYRQ